MHIHGMTLDQWLAENRLTEAEFAPRIGVTQSTVNRIRKGQMPSRDTIEAIFRETSGEVTANDLAGLTTNESAAS